MLLTDILVEHEIPSEYVHGANNELKTELENKKS